MKESEIKITVSTDENNLPVSMKWNATDAGIKGDMETKAVMVSIWDNAENNTMRLDLWTKDMLIDDMKTFFYQTLLSMADTLERATSEEKMASEMRDFCEYFAEEMKVEKEL